MKTSKQAKRAEKKRRQRQRKRQQKKLEKKLEAEKNGDLLNTTPQKQANKGDEQKDVADNQYAGQMTQRDAKKTTDQWLIPQNSQHTKQLNEATKSSQQN